MGADPTGRDCFQRIAACGIGYLRLKSAIPPWGRLYFVLDRNGYQLLRRAGRESDATLTPTEDQRVKLNLAWFGVLCFLHSGLARVMNPHPSQLREALQPAPKDWLLVLMFRFQDAVLTHPSVGVSIVWLIFLSWWAASSRNHPQAWLMAAVAGGYLANVVFHWL